jgi:hypothetical protein
MSTRNTPLPIKTAVNQDALLESFAAELIHAAYCVALRTGTQATWLDLELNLWTAPAGTVKTWGSELSNLGADSR